MKKSFVTGLVILLPLALTIAIVVFMFNLLTTPFLGIVNSIFEHYHLFSEGFLFLNADQFQNLIAQLLIFACLFLFTLGLGMIARWFFFRSFIRFAEFFVKKIPLVRTIYKTTNDVIKTIFTTDSKSFKQVVLVRFPNPSTYAVGLVTREDLPPFKNTPYEDVVAVFVPTTPNPTSGFLIMYSSKELVYLDMKVEDAFKYIVSCGVILPTFKVATKEEIIKNLEGFTVDMTEMKGDSQ